MNRAAAGISFIAAGVWLFLSYEFQLNGQQSMTAFAATLAAIAFVVAIVALIPKGGRR